MRNITKFLNEVKNLKINIIDYCKVNYYFTYINHRNLNNLIYMLYNYLALRGVQGRSAGYESCEHLPALEGVDGFRPITTTSTEPLRCVLPARGLGYAVLPSPHRAIWHGIPRCGDRTLRLKSTVPEAERPGSPVSLPKEGSTPTTTWDHLAQTPAF